MKTRFLKSILALLLTFVVMPMMAQDCMKVCFKDGSTVKYYLEKVIEISTSKVDEDGVVHSDYDYQHVITSNGTYIFKLSDIDCITFTKISESQTAQSFASVSEVALDALSDCETIEDAEAKIEQIKSSSEVEDAWRDGANLYVKSKNGDIIPFHYSHSLEDTEAGAKMMMQAKSFLEKYKEVLKPSNTKLKAAIVNQMHKDESRTKMITQYYYPLRDLFNYYDISTEYIDSLGIDFFYRTEPKPGEEPRPTMYDFDIIFLMTHGDYDQEKNSHYLLLSTELGIEKKSGKHQSEDLKKICEEKYFSYKENELGGLLNDVECLSIGYNEEKRNGHKHFVCYVYLNELFFEKKAKDKFTNPISILFNGACMSLKGNHNLAETLFKEQKLGVYLGYNETNFLSYQTGYEWFISLLNGKSLYKAYEDLPEKHKTETGSLTNIPSWNYLNAELEIGKRDGLDLQNLYLFPTITKQVDQTVATITFNNSDHVLVEGNATSYDPEKIFFGFEYGTDESMYSVSRVFTTDVVKLTKFLDNGNGNVTFRGQLTNLEPDKTYYYRAYTYDGLYYNYGNIEQFTVYKSLSLSTKVVSLKVGESSTVEITGGSGEYEVDDKNSPYAKATLQGTAITISAVSVGDATVVVTDKKTGQQITIEVAVTKDDTPTDVPAEAMDLGLPSGTKWASYNVGATKPEEYGGYYSWGETEVRDQYYFTTYSLCDGTVSSCHDIGENISGTEYDVAHVKWGGDWCMPTKDDFQELVYTCEYKETTRNGVKGYQFTGPNGKYIFLPYTGYYWNTENSNAGSEGCYWSATQTTSVNRAHEMSFKKDEVLWDCYINRFAGLSVRPVMHSTPSLADLTLSTTDPVTVVVDDKAIIEITSGNGSYTAESDNEDVAIARVYDNASVIIKGVSVGSATITVTDTKSGQTATVAVTVTGTINPDVSPGEAIDLGLPSGTKWASCNVGASKPEEYGGHYAWGETEEKDYYDWSTYIHCDGSSSTCHDLGSDISGTEYDVAHVKWGGKWCMPTFDDMKELLDNCTTEWTSLNGVNGRKFTSKLNGNSIFLPAAGCRRYGDLSVAGEYGLYWSSTRRPNYSYGAYGLYFDSGVADWSGYYYLRFNGRSVRPVVIN